MLAIKEGAKILGIRPEILLAYIIVGDVYHEAKVEADCTLTECTGEKHGKASLHYVGLAIDVRIWSFQTPEELEHIRYTIQKRLGSQYDVVLESTHFHIEFQPK